MVITQDDIDAFKEDTIGPYFALAEFIRSFGASLDPRLWVKLVDEELKEIYAEEPHTPNHLKEYADLLYVFIGLDLVSNDRLGSLVEEEERANISKLMGKAERTLQEYHKHYGEDTIAKAFTRVHKSNMSKLGDDGKPIKREDGKVLKGPNYKAPDLTDLL